MNQIQLAELLARRAHEGQLEPHTGDPYILHVERVAGYVAHESEIVQAVAWLHDVLEDTALTLSDMMREGVSEEVLTGVLTLTRNKGEIYREYITRVRSGGSVAITVKLADLEDHLRPSSYLPESLRKRYDTAVAQLNG